MLPIYVVGTVIVGTLFYTVLKIKIQQWIVESKMSRLSIKKDPPSSPETIVITDDESDGDEDVLEICEVESKVPVDTKILDSCNDKAGSSGSSLTKMISMFSWKKQVLPTFIDSDSSDEEKKPMHCTKQSNGDNSTIKEETEEQPATEPEVCPPPGKKIKKERTGKCFNKEEETVAKGNAHLFDAETDDNENVKHFDKNTKANQSSIPNKLPEVTIRKTYKVSGIEVKLPVNPYSCQTAVISKIIQACNTEKNCLLESPTGSGKTLALLCGVLAWQDHYRQKVLAENREASTSTDFKSPDGQEKTFKNGHGDNLERFLEERKKCTVPRIYYGTRTHRQIEQVIREFKKTVYRDKRMTILSSREHTCIQQTEKNKTEFCNDLLDPVKKGSCPFLMKDLNQRPLSSHARLQKIGLQTPWDIEDFVKIGKNLETCPYFSARDLKESAEIIFCPYNYLVDPDIRESMDISLKGEIVILDEAHNIEEICRDVASKECREDHLHLAARDLKSISVAREENSTVYPESCRVYNNLANYLTALANFLKSQRVESAEMNSDVSRSKYWTGEEFEALLKMPTLAPLGDFTMFNSSVHAVLKDFKIGKEDLFRSSEMSAGTSSKIIGETTRKILETLYFCLQMITSTTYCKDYRVCIIELVVNDLVKPPRGNVWISAKKTTESARVLQFMCMNSALTFSLVTGVTRSIILASGTLSPTTSFASELGTEFSFTLSAQHIIPKERVYVRCIPRGPTGKPLKATYQYINQWTFQEELGRLILSVCKAVPHGVLCFFSSYNTLNNHIKRWRETQEKIWEKLQNLKHIFIEPRYGAHLAEIMGDYRDAIKATAKAPKNQVNGAILFAVFRGKIAEGIDFSDDEARCVLAVGIPYAVRKEPSVDMKYTYNDLHHTSKKLLKGGEWYAVQAFRALNQALGRCVRHQNDWGAVLLVDERFQMPTNIRYLPRWIQAMLRSNSNYNLGKELETFVARLKGEVLNETE